MAGLEALGADVLIPLDQPANSLTKAFRTEIKNDGVDVVLDYLWGPSAESLIAAAAGHGSRDAEPRIRFVQIGSLSGGTITLPAGSLREAKSENAAALWHSLRSEPGWTSLDTMLEEVAKLTAHSKSDRQPDPPLLRKGEARN